VCFWLPYERWRLLPDFGASAKQPLILTLNSQIKCGDESGFRVGGLGIGLIVVDWALPKD